MGWFSWYRTAEGHGFWYAWYQSIEQILRGEIRVSKEFDGWHTSPIDTTISTKTTAPLKAIKDVLSDGTTWTTGYHISYEEQQKLNNLLKREEYESRLQEQEADLHRGDSGKSIRVCNRGNKARVAKFSLSYKKVLGRS